LRKVNCKEIGRVKIKSTKECVNHQYDSTLVTYSANLIKKFIIKDNAIKPEVYSTFIEDRLLRSLEGHTFESLATFKSSASIRPHDTVDTMNEDDLKNPQRRRVLEGVISLLDIVSDSSSIFNSISKIFDTFTKSELAIILANIFRKPQIGSDREIFILSICSRILILGLESMSRSMCELIPWEMLTKGSEKITRVSSHKMKEMKEYYIKKNSSPKVLRSYDSNDASSWAQSFVMKMFFDMLRVLLPKDYLEYTRTILNVVTSKQLEIPGLLLSEFKKNQSEYVDVNLEELKNQFLGKSDFKDLCNFHGTRLKNRSNMMQGILHYTSSYIMLVR
jgi:hypothetical protein